MSEEESSAMYEARHNNSHTESLPQDQAMASRVPPVRHEAGVRRVVYDEAMPSRIPPAKHDASTTFSRAN